MKVAFYQPHLCLRGTTVAMFDYAYYNRELLGNESIIFYDRANPRNHSTTIDKFSTFKCVAIDSFKDLDTALEKEQCDAVYFVKGGWRDSRLPTACKSLIHVIGTAPATEKHGDVYAYGSYWLSEFCSGGTLPAVPYMVTLPDVNEDLRKVLGIAPDAVVFGRNGGMDTWNLPYADQVIKTVLEQKENVYFLFQHTPLTFTHRRVIHLPSTSDMVFKTKFINTCDAMIHARHEGESFGLSCGEFSLRNKPVITWFGSRERNHIEILGEKGIYYNNPEEMKTTLLDFEKQPHKDWNCYTEYTPEKIIKIFDKVFLK